MRGAVLVLGATGEVGGRVVEGLLEGGERVRGASRDPAGASRVSRVSRVSEARGSARGSARGAAGASLEWARVDLEDPATFPGALDGVDRVFMVARPGDDSPDEVAGPFVEAMRLAGVRRVANLTAVGVETEPEFGLRRVELLVESSGLEWTHLRPNFFMQIFAGPPLLGAIVATGEIRLPAGAARLSYVDTRDVAAAAVAVLRTGGHGGRAYTLTGPESLDHHGVARRLSEAAGAKIMYRPLTEPEARAQMAAAGLGPERVERLIGFYRRVRSGHGSPVSPDVESLLGRPGGSFAEFAARYADRWRGAGAVPGGGARSGSASGSGRAAGVSAARRPAR